MTGLILFNVFFAFYNFVFYWQFKKRYSLVCGWISLAMALVLVLTLYH